MMQRRNVFEEYKREQTSLKAHEIRLRDLETTVLTRLPSLGLLAERASLQEVIQAYNNLVIEMRRLNGEY